MRLSDYLFLIFKYLKNKKARAILTSLGMTIGVAVIFTLISLSNGLSNYIESIINKLENKVIFIAAGGSLGRGFLFTFTGYIPNNVIQNIERLPGVEKVIPSIQQAVTINYENNNILAYLFILDTKYMNDLQYTGIEIQAGTLPISNSVCDVAIGYEIANNNIKKISIGDYINIFGKKCRVVGILQQTGSPVIDNRIIFPLGYYKMINQGQIKYNYLIIITSDYNLAYNSIKNYINTIGSQNYSIITAENIRKNFEQILNAITIYSLILASISIIISAINILNTMWTAVLERYKEIGLLKALGMTDNQILFLFILEAGIIGLIGGIAGIIFGIIAGNIVTYIFAIQGLHFSPYITPSLILFSLFFPFFIGIISGLIPAIKAAKINPVEALRYE